MIEGLYREKYNIPFYTFPIFNILIYSTLMSWLSLISPVSVWHAVIYFSIIFILGILVLRKKNYQSIIKFFSDRKFLLFLLGTAVFSVSGSSLITYNDTLIYHTQAIKWIQEYAVVPGLGNLHTRFAFNSHLFIANAGMSFEWKGAIFYPFNTILLILFVHINIHHIYEEYRNGFIFGLIVKFTVLVICLLLYPFWSNTPSPDIAAAVLTLLSFYYFMDIRSNNGEINVIILLALILTAFTYKISTVFLLLLPAYAMVYIWINEYETLKRRRLVIILVMSFLIILLPFFLRNIILSGYLVYPFPRIDFIQVDWKIPIETAYFDMNYINAWAKVPRAEVDEVLSMRFSEWFPLWWNKKSLPFKMILIGTLFSSILTLYLLIKKQWHEFFVLLVVWVNILFWWVTAPDPRFIHGILFLAFAISLGFIFQKCSILHKFISLNVIYFIIGSVMLSSLFTIKDDVKELFQDYFIVPKPYPISKQKIVKGQNFNYRIPNTDNQCFNSVLPCAEKIIPKLELRGKQISDGFRIANK